MENIAMYLDYNLDIEKRSVWNIAHATLTASEYPFIINESGVFYARGSFYTKRYAKNDYQLLYTVSGAAELEYEGNTWRLEEGSLVMLDCNAYHDYRTAADSGHWTYYWLHVGGPYCARYYSAAYPSGFRLILPGVDRELTAPFQEAIEQIGYTTDAAYMRMNHAVSSIFTNLAMFSPSATLPVGEGAISQAIRYLNAHYAEPLRIEDLAKRANLSKYYFIKRFEKHTGMTPYRYLIAHRINEAKKLLRTTDFKIDNIAEAVGFADVSNFSRTFAKATGISPRRYRREDDSDLLVTYPLAR
jgi:AraC-like DNA-binding protein